MGGGIGRGAGLVKIWYNISYGWWEKKSVVLGGAGGDVCIRNWRRVVFSILFVG